MSKTQPKPNPRGEPPYVPAWRRALNALEEELVGVHPRLHVYNVASGILPPRGAAKLRASLLRLTGASIGSGTRVHGALKITGPGNWQRHLQIGENCELAAHCLLDLSEQ